MDAFLQSYLPIIVFLAIALVIGLALLIPPFLIAHKAPDVEKLHLALHLRFLKTEWKTEHRLAVVDFLEKSWSVGGFIGLHVCRLLQASDLSCDEFRLCQQVVEISQKRQTLEIPSQGAESLQA